jgi:hypothetical protein
VKADPLRLVRTFVGAALLVGVVALPSTPAAQAEAQAPAAAGPTESTYRVDDVVPELRALPGGGLAARAEALDPFTTIGASYESPSGAEGRVRAHLAAGWTPWFDLHHGHGGGASTDPVWVGDAADGYELRLPTDATGSVVHLVRPTGEPEALTPTPATATEAGNPAPPVQRRSAWGAAPYRGTIRYNDRVTRGVVHHTVNTNGYSAAQVPSMLRSIQAYHQGSARNWPDIAYNFIVDRFGTIWEARARSHDRLTRVSASSGTTEDTVTVAFLGDGSSQSAPSAAVRSMGRLLGWKLRRHGLRPTRANVVGHTQIGQTSCPGAALLGQVPTIERIAIDGNPPPGPFYDVPWASPISRAVDWAADERIIPGYEDLTFRPTRQASRADAAVWLWRLAGQPAGPFPDPYTDVPEGAPYRRPVLWASAEGLLRGITETRFVPARTVTRDMLVNALWRYLGEPDVPEAHDYGDAGPRAALDWADAFGLAPGTSFRGGDAVTRGTGASWLFRTRPFADLGPNHVARKAADWARVHLIVAPLPSHTFVPDRVLNRAQASTWVWRFMDHPSGGPVDPAPGGDDLNRATAVTWLWEAAGSPTVTLPSDYSDVAAQSHEMAAAWAQDFALFVEFATNPTFAGATEVTRAQLVRALYRLAQRPTAWDPSVTPPGTVHF